GRFAVKAFCCRYIDPWPLLAFLLPLCLYLWCLAPTITFYDSGEFATAVNFLGSAHSPGYPLFLLYAKPFTWLPFGNIAYRSIWQLLFLLLWRVLLCFLLLGNF
ncbi:DUF2723 domain-containing protein, partial [bacterium]|nr:DUF2723 domain-containing protein [bacterium]